MPQRRKLYKILDPTTGKYLKAVGSDGRFSWADGRNNAWNTEGTTYTVSGARKALKDAAKSLIAHEYVTSMPDRRKYISGSGNEAFWQQRRQISEHVNAQDWQARLKLLPWTVVEVQEAVIETGQRWTPDRFMDEVHT